MPENVSLLQRCLYIIDVIGHQIMAVLTVYFLWTLLIQLDIKQVFTWHTVLCTLAYLPLMGEAIVLFSKDHLWSQNLNRSVKTAIHVAFMMVSAIILTVGIFIFTNEIGPDADHFKGNHALTGFISWIFVVVACIMGIFSGNAQKFKAFIKPVYFKFIHNLIGLLGFLLGIVSLGYSLGFGTFTKVVTTESINAAISLLALLATWISVSSIISGFNQLKAMAS